LGAKLLAMSRVCRFKNTHIYCKCPQSLACLSIDKDKSIDFGIAFKKQIPPEGCVVKISLENFRCSKKYPGGTHSSPRNILLHLNILKDQTISQRAIRNSTSPNYLSKSLACFLNFSLVKDI
jgi:hypothetical protein